MITKTDREYHPMAACTLFKVLLNGAHARANLAAAVKYGMKAERAGVSLEDAMSDFNLVLDAQPAQPAPRDKENDYGS